MSTLAMRIAGPPTRVLSGPVKQGTNPRFSVKARAAPGSPDGEDKPKKGFFDNIFDFESWAPRSAKIWRLQQYDYEASTSSDEESDAVSDLQDRVRRQSMDASMAGSIDADSTPVDMPLPQRSFEDVGDSELASSLSSRIQQLTSAEEDEAEADAQEGAVGAGVVQEEEEEEPMTGEELRALVFKKYGKNYDVSLVRRDIPGKTFVCLNVMWSYLEQRSFKMTREQYEEKLDSVAYLLNAVGQADAIRAQLSGPAKSQNGMPSRPVVGTAVSLKLQVSEAVVREWFGRGYQ